MKKTSASIRYAKALFALALASGQTEDVLKDLKMINQTINKEVPLINLISNPTITRTIKQNVFKKLFVDKINKTTGRFLSLIIKKRRESFLLDIIEKYQQTYNAHHNISVVEIISAKALSDETKESIKQKMSLQGGVVELKQRIDPNLIGGFIIKRGDFQYDTTIRRKLNNAKRAFKL